MLVVIFLIGQVLVEYCVHACEVHDFVSSKVTLSIAPKLHLLCMYIMYKTFCVQTFPQLPSRINHPASASIHGHSFYWLLHV